MQGVDNALYSLTTQVIRKSEKNPTDPEAKGFNELVIYEEVPYEYILGPKEKIVFQIKSSEKTFFLYARASSPVTVCMTEDIFQPPFEPNCEVNKKNFTEVEDLITLDKGKVANIGVTNDKDKSVTLKLIASKQMAICEPASLNTLMVKQILDKGKDEDGISYHCL